MGAWEHELWSRKSWEHGNMDQEVGSHGNMDHAVGSHGDMDHAVWSHGNMGTWTCSRKSWEHVNMTCSRKSWEHGNMTWMGTWEHGLWIGNHGSMGTCVGRRWEHGPFKGEDGETWVESEVAVGVVLLRSAKWGRGWECNKRSQGDVQWRWAESYRIPRGLMLPFDVFVVFLRSLCFCSAFVSSDLVSSCEFAGREREGCRLWNPFRLWFVCMRVCVTIAVFLQDLQEQRRGWLAGSLKILL
jgi:hypothetical protein